MRTVQQPTEDINEEVEEIVETPLVAPEVLINLFNDNFPE